MVRENIHDDSRKHVNNVKISQFHRSFSNLQFPVVVSSYSISGRKAQKEVSEFS